MADLLKIMLESIQGQQVSAAFAFVVILAILGGFGYFIFNFMKSYLIEAPSYVKGKKERKTNIIYSAEEWLRSEDGQKFLEDTIITHIKLNDERILEKVSKKVKSDLSLQIFKDTKALYDRISEMREEYAGSYATKREMEPFIEDLDDLRIDFAKLKGHLNINS